MKKLIIILSLFVTVVTCVNIYAADKTVKVSLIDKSSNKVRNWNIFVLQVVDMNDNINATKIAEELKKVKGVLMVDPHLLAESKRIIFYLDMQTNLNNKEILSVLAKNGLEITSPLTELEIKK